MEQRARRRKPRKVSHGRATQSSRREQCAAREALASASQAPPSARGGGEDRRRPLFVHPAQESDESASGEGETPSSWSGQKPNSRPTAGRGANPAGPQPLAPLGALSCDDLSPVACLLSVDRATGECDTPAREPVACPLTRANVRGAVGGDGGGVESGTMGAPREGGIGKMPWVSLASPRLAHTRRILSPSQPQKRRTIAHASEIARALDPELKSPRNA